jgi:hypothetical protein
MGDKKALDTLVNVRSGIASALISAMEMGPQYRSPSFGRWARRAKLEAKPIGSGPVATTPMGARLDRARRVG